MEVWAELLAQSEVTHRYNPYYYDVVEAMNHFRVDYTSLLYSLSVYTPSNAVDGPPYFTKPWRWAELLNQSNNWEQSILL
jgi:hypothetical protein